MNLRQTKLEIQNAQPGTGPMVMTKPNVKISWTSRLLKDHDEQIQAIFEAIQQLVAPPERSRKKNALTFWSNDRDRAKYSYFMAPDFLRSIEHSERIT